MWVYMGICVLDYGCANVPIFIHKCNACGRFCFGYVIGVSIRLLGFNKH